MPKISIITPYRNAEVFLPGLVRTLQQQTFPDWECLLVDDGSQDRSSEVVARCSGGDPRFRPLTLPLEPAGGCGSRRPARPRNFGLGRINGPLVAFLDCDDLWHPRKLEDQLAFHHAGNLDLSVTAYGRFRRLEEGLEAVRCPPEQLSLGSMLRTNPIPLLTVLIRAELLEQGFPLVPHEDYLLWLNLRRDHPGLRYGRLPSLLAFYRLHAANQSRHLLQVTGWTYGVFRRHGLGRAAALRQLVRWGTTNTARLLRERRPSVAMAPPTLPLAQLLLRSPLPVEQPLAGH